MGLGSWLSNLLVKKKEISEKSEFSEIPLNRLETSDKILETRIRPVKLPSTIEIGERLGFILRDLSNLKEEMISKSWFKAEYEDASPEIIEKLGKVESRLEQLNGLLNNLSNVLSNLQVYGKPELSKTITTEQLDINEKILDIIKKSQKIRYKDIAKELNVTDPTITKHLKILLTSNKIRKTKVGKAVFYELVNQPS
ncbi:MAG: winged helix-turn-helix domain-containing protein [Candidatus Aenigmarchaeota archaeon]|nr:winged helix-turn-helix domain-containing protein [Candidatus Aenigmarchaeota archaeon]